MQLSLPQFYDKITTHSNTPEILEWFERLTDSDQEKLMDSTRGRKQGEHPTTFMRRTHAKRKIAQTIDRYNRHIKITGQF